VGEGRDEERDERTDDHVDVVALVLGDVEGQRRSAMAAHLLACPTCRSEYDEVSTAVAALLPAVPAVQPPIGFDEQVLGRLGRGARPSASAPPGRGTPLRHRRAWLAGAAAAVAIAVGAVGGWWATRVDDDAISDVSPLELVNGGEAVGTVSIGDVDGAPLMVVAVVDAPDGVSYLCRTTFTDGTTADSEAWPPGSGAWIVPLPADGADTVRSVDLVVDGTDHVWSTATFDTDTN
jgi:hypothetical protein